MTAALPLAIQAEFATYRLVPSRSRLQLVLEVSAEQAEQTLQVLGYPVPGESIWVGVARLNEPMRPNPDLVKTHGNSPVISQETDEATYARKGGVEIPLKARPLSGVGKAGERVQGPQLSSQNPEEVSPLEPPSARPSAASPTEDPPPLPLAGATPKAKDLAKSVLMRSLYRSLSTEDRAVSDAVLLAKNEAFRSWVAGGRACSEADAADFIRMCCEVRSRSEFATNEVARARYYKLVGKYQLETGRIAEVRG